MRCNSSIPNIDFKDSFILAGRKELTTCGQQKDQHIALKCN